MALYAFFNGHAWQCNEPDSGRERTVWNYLRRTLDHLSPMNPLFGDVASQVMAYAAQYHVGVHLKDSPPPPGRIKCPADDQVIEAPLAAVDRTICPAGHDLDDAARNALRKAAEEGLRTWRESRQNELLP